MHQTAVVKLNVWRHAGCLLTFVSGLDHCSALLILRGNKQSSSMFFPQFSPSCSAQGRDLTPNSSISASGYYRARTNVVSGGSPRSPRGLLGNQQKNHALEDLLGEEKGTTEPLDHRRGTRRDETMRLLSMSEMRSDHKSRQNIKYKLQQPIHLTL